jgi:hypothetical protein
MHRLIVLGPASLRDLYDVPVWIAAGEIATRPRISDWFQHSCVCILVGLPQIIRFYVDGETCLVAVESLQCSLSRLGFGKQLEWASETY